MRLLATAQGITAAPAPPPVAARRGWLKRVGAVLGAALLARPTQAAPAGVLDSGEVYVGEIILFAGTFAPYGWALCDGSLLPISEYEVLFYLLGTTYLGDGQTTFGLPDLRGRAPRHLGQAPGAAAYTLGQKAGAESTTLTSGMLPSHQHNLQVAALATSSTPAGNVPAVPTGTDVNGEKVAIAAYTTPATGTEGPMAIAATGSSTPFSTRPPELAMLYCISLFGIYPSQA